MKGLTAPRRSPWKLQTICHLGHIWEGRTTGPQKAEMSGKGRTWQGRASGADGVCVCVPVLARGTPALPPASSTALLGPLPYPDPC